MKRNKTGECTSRRVKTSAQETGEAQSEDLIIIGTANVINEEYIHVKLNSFWKTLLCVHTIPSIEKYSQRVNYSFFFSV